MTESRKYRLLCPIARALDRLGDRWALLVLRDLHAGPARFGELLAGLSGIASNLLTSRLDDLSREGMIRKFEGTHQITLYELTPLGQHTANLLYELAAFGSRLPVERDVRPAGNLRTLAVTLKVACSRVVTPDVLLAVELRIDGEPFTLRAKDGRVDVRVGRCEAPQVVLESDYESIVAVIDGVLAPQDFATRATVTASDPGALANAFGLLGAAMSRIAADSPADAAPIRPPAAHGIPKGSRRRKRAKDR